MSFYLPELPYAFDALEPHIDTETMEIHYQRHHKAYFDKFVAAIEGVDTKGKNLHQIMENISEFSLAVRNNGGGFYNHIVYWHSMSPSGGGEPEGALADAINTKFGSFEAFKDTFSQAAIGQFGSGFAWLVVDSAGELVINTTPNQDNPVMDVNSVQGHPILACDVWEHAYYVSYRNKRPDYIEAWWKVVNWEYVSREFEKAQAG